MTADFNGDGWSDIFLNRHMDPAKLYINDHDGTFTLTDFGTFPDRDRHGCASADVNGDGRLDLFCNTGSDRGTEAKRDELWIQQANGDFQEKASQYGVLQPFDRGRIPGFIDADNDGRPDVYAANFPDRADGMPSSNCSVPNQGGRRTGWRPSSALIARSTGARSRSGITTTMVTTIFWWRHRAAFACSATTPARASRRSRPRWDWTTGAMPRGSWTSTGTGSWTSSK